MIEGLLLAEKVQQKYTFSQVDKGKTPMRNENSMVILSLVCVFSTIGGILLGQSLKGLLVLKNGVESGQRQMVGAGIVSVALAFILSVTGSSFSSLCNCKRK